MAIEVKIPRISEGVDSADVSEILVKEGDTVEKEQALIVLETDKASAEVPSSHAGTVKEIKIKEGDEVSVGDVILTLEGDEDQEEEKDKKEEKPEEKSGKEKEKEDKGKEKEKDGNGDGEEEQQTEDQEKTEKEDTGPEKKEKKDKPEKQDSGEKEQEEKPEDKEEEKEEKQQEEDPDQSGPPASPGVRRLARELGVELSSISGSGPGGRVTEEDVKSHTKDRKKAGKESAGSPALPDFSKWGSTETKELSRIRVATGQSTTSSWQSIPHVFQFDEADISGIHNYMEENREKAEKEGGKLTITAILVKIAASALQQFPKFNASIDPENEQMILKHYINISIAVDTGEGLLMPVIKDVDKKNIIELAGEVTSIAKKAREGNLSPDDMQGGNFSISNLGGIGGTNFTPIVYHPQVAILGISRARTQPRYINGQFEPRDILPLSLSYDHRLIDGAEGAKFLNWISQALEDPYKALLG